MKSEDLYPTHNCHIKCSDLARSPSRLLGIPRVTDKPWLELHLFISCSLKTDPSLNSHISSLLTNYCLYSRDTITLFES